MYWRNPENLVAWSRGALVVYSRMYRQPFSHLWHTINSCPSLDPVFWASARLPSNRLASKGLPLTFVSQNFSSKWNYSVGEFCFIGSKSSPFPAFAACWRNCCSFLSCLLHGCNSWPGLKCVCTRKKIEIGKKCISLMTFGTQKNFWDNPKWNCNWRILTTYNFCAKPQFWLQNLQQPISAKMCLLK